MFFRYISENLTNYINAGKHNTSNTELDNVQMFYVDAKEDREGLVEEKAFSFFCLNCSSMWISDPTMRKIVVREQVLGDEIAKIIAEIEVCK